MRYLGGFFVSANSLKCNLQNARQKFFTALNGIFAKIGANASPAVLLSLVNSHCLPVLLCGIESLTTTNLGKQRYIPWHTAREFSILFYLAQCDLLKRVLLSMTQVLHALHARFLCAPQHLISLGAAPLATKANKNI